MSALQEEEAGKKKGIIEELRERMNTLNESEWTCGHITGAVCAECYRMLAAKAHALQMQLDDLRQRIQDALGTAEVGEGLIEVARNAHRAEQELAATKRLTHRRKT